MSDTIYKTEENVWLDAQSLGMILDKCGKNGVRELALSGTECVVKFGPELPEVPSFIGRQTEEIPIKEEIETKEDRLTQMMIEDPSAYESFIVEGETDAETHG